MACISPAKGWSDAVTMWAGDKQYGRMTRAASRLLATQATESTVATTLKFLRETPCFSQELLQAVTISREHFLVARELFGKVAFYAMLKAFSW